ncbi:MAG: D-alanine--D-alanine ligase [Alphaproteobacteria bacterium]|nr:D-alanine--D-alanine ligase [Alphaproteobacteria bacterium]
MSQTKTSTKVSGRKKIAVFIGGRSPEHDVSVVSGLQVYSAIDRSAYDPFIVYISTNGRWFIGEGLEIRGNYIPKDFGKFTEVTMDMNGSSNKGILIPKEKGLFSKPKPIEFDAAIPVFHGLYGEDGNIQGMFEFANIPYAGMRTKASSILMDKITTKYVLQTLDIPVLPFAKINRPEDGGYLVPEGKLEEILGPIGFPCILKPAHLGSSIGVAKVNDVKEAKACLPAIFEYDVSAIAEPFVPNLVEYNVSVGRISGALKTSAIERPKSTDELLDFKQKYLSGFGSGKDGDKLGGNKQFSGPVSEGMLSLTREINPDIPSELDSNIRKWAFAMFEALDGTGAPRIDFIGNRKTGEIWMNEVNPLPGSFAYFLWEAAADSVLFTDLMTSLIEEAFAQNRSMVIPSDPVPKDARLLKR